MALTALCTALAACGGGGGGGGAPAASTSGQNSSGGTGPSAAAGATGSVTIRWVPPTEHEDGTPLASLRGYRVHWGTVLGKYPHSAAIDSPGIATYVVEHLAPARWHFVVTAVSTNGLESDYSNVYTRTVP